MDALEGALADAGQRRIESAAEAAAKAAEAAAHRQKLVEGMKLAIEQHHLTVEELFPAQPAAPDDAPADAVEWDEPKLTAEAERLFREGKTMVEVGEELKKLVPGDDIISGARRATAIQAGKAASMIAAGA